MPDNMLHSYHGFSTAWTVVRCPTTCCKLFPCPLIILIRLGDDQGISRSTATRLAQLPSLQLMLCRILQLDTIVKKHVGTVKENLYDPSSTELLPFS